MATGSGLPTPPGGGPVLAQAAGGVSGDALFNAQSWGQIAQAGEQLAKAGGDYLKVAEHQALVGQFAEQDVEIARERAIRRDKFANNPAAFEADWQGYTEGKLAAAPPIPKLIDHMKARLGQEGNSAFSAILSEKRSLDHSFDVQRTETAIKQADAEVIGAAMSGTLKNPDGRVKALKFRNAVDAAVTSRLMTQEKADFMVDDLEGRALSEVAGRDAVAVYRGSSYEKAVDYLKKEILENEGIGLKATARRTAFSAGLKQVNLERQLESQDRVGVVQESKDLQARIVSGQPYDEAEFRDTVQALGRVRATSQQSRLVVEHAVRQETTGLDTRGLAVAAATNRSTTAARGTPEQAGAIATTASRLGVAPRDLAAAISYETGGTFDPNKVGGKGNNYMGLIQFGPEERQKYGVRPGMTFEQQMGAVEGFLRDRGVKPGMGISEIYRTINGGNPNVSLNASDGNGTIAQHIQRIQAGHYGNADKFLGAPPAGLVEVGNIDLNNRPVVKNADGSISTVRSMSVGFNGKEVLIPTVSPDGRILNEQDAIALYRQTGQHLGKFKTVAEATAYAKTLSSDQSQQYGTVDTTGQSGEITRRVQQRFVEQARKTWTELKPQIDAGKAIEDDDLNAVRYAAALSGDAAWIKQTNDLAMASGLGKSMADLPMTERQAMIDEAQGRFSETVNKSLRSQFDRQNKMVRESPVDYAIESGQSAPEPINLSSSEAARAGVGLRVNMARGVAQQQAVAAGSPFRAADRAQMAAAIERGDPKQAAVAMDALTSVPDEMLISALKSAEIKDAIGGAVRSSDPARYGAAMGFLDKMWARAPETTKQIFGEDAVHSLMTWQSNLRYATPDALAQERQKATLDPQVRERQKKNTEEGLKLAREYSVADITKQFDTSWWITPSAVARSLGTQPQVPVDAFTRDALMGDFETQFARRFAETGDKAKALEQTTALMKTKWSSSPVNGGRLMVNGPEKHYPAIDGSWDWMTRQIEADISTRLGRPKETPGGLGRAGTYEKQWDYSLVSDRQTGAEAQAGQPPSYQVVITDAAAGGLTLLPERYKFDAGPDSEKRRDDFESQRRRVLESINNPPDTVGFGAP